MTEKILDIAKVVQDYINQDKNMEEIFQMFEKNIINQSGLLSLKPKLYVCNVDEKSIKFGNKYTEEFINKFGNEDTIVISAEIENQIMELEEKDKKYFMKESGIKEIGLNLLIKAGYKILKLETFFTSGPEETRAWTVPRQSRAIKAAGTIHSDFEKGFIRAETISYKDFVFYKGYNEAKNNGKLRLEGKDYIVQDGDVMLFRFNT